MISSKTLIAENSVVSDFVCPLCLSSHGSKENQPWWQDKFRDYFRCEQCQLVFVPKPFHLSAEDEKACYDLHDNNSDDEGYRRFLTRMFDPIAARITPSGLGLDFGCGPGPVLAEMFSEAGFSIKLFDLYYANNPDVIDVERNSECYDFITATEVVEHLCDPHTVLSNLWALLRPGGVLGLMTKQVKDHESFKNWHYIRDRTHIVFFSRATFEWLAQQTGCCVEFVGADVVLLTKTG